MNENNTSGSGAEDKPLPRVERLTRDGEVAWLKRPERIKGRMRMQKGDPVAAFTAEKDLYTRFSGGDLPIPKLIEASDDHFVIADAGPNLISVLRDDATSPILALEVLVAAAKALAKLHASQIAHGRPALKDICWKDGRITFIDWERSGPSRNNKSGFSDDIVTLFFTTVVELGVVDDRILAMKAAYRAADHDQIWERAIRRVGWLRWALLPLFPIINRLKSKPEFRAVQPFSDFFR